MPQKVKSVTTSQKSFTSEPQKTEKPKAPPRATGLATPVQYLKGVGPRLGAILSARGLTTARDLLYYFPRDYQDRQTILSVAALRARWETQAPSDPSHPLEPEAVTLRGRILSYRTTSPWGRGGGGRGGRGFLEAVFADDTGRIALKWFHFQPQYLIPRLKDQPYVTIFGKPNFYGGRLEIVHPELESIDAPTLDGNEVQLEKGILPIYPEPEGINQKLLRKLLAQVLILAKGDGYIAEADALIPLGIQHNLKLMALPSALQNIHQPPPSQDPAADLESLRSHQSQAHRRLIFQDFFQFQLIVAHRRLALRKETAATFAPQDLDSRLASFERRIPFALTDDQRHTMQRIFDDLSLSKPMNRLVQGDVGCGKTMVALASTIPVSACGAQSTLLAPTEILAQQHFLQAQKYLEGQVELLTGSTPKAQRQRILDALAKGEISVLVGTHALLEPQVVFQNLGLVIVDEQHRFGVDQRRTLREKGKMTPHCLNMTATPIPRTLAMTAYGDLDVSTIRQLPKGRAAIHTKIVKQNEMAELYAFIGDQIRGGRQAYIIYPLVEESEKIDLANAVSAAETLANGPFASFKLGLLHGKMKPQEKSDVMERFKKGELQILVSTTVIEVGVDVPNASVMVIEHAERFGLSQLHQLRGRIGRGIYESFCYLKSDSFVTPERLQAMEQTRDGFHLAELDLKLRGPGEFLGTRQSGELSFPMANLARDQEILTQARQAVFDIISKDPHFERPEHAALRRFMDNEGKLVQSRYETA